MVSPSPLLRDWPVVSDDGDMYRGEDCTPPYSAASQQPSTLTFPGCTKLSFSSRTFTISLELSTDRLDLRLKASSDRQTKSVISILVLIWEASKENTCGVSDHYGTWLILTQGQTFMLL